MADNCLAADNSLAVVADCLAVVDNFLFLVDNLPVVDNSVETHHCFVSERLVFVVEILPGIFNVITKQKMSCNFGKKLKIIICRQIYLRVLHVGRPVHLQRFVVAKKAFQEAVVRATNEMMIVKTLSWILFFKNLPHKLCLHGQEPET